MPSCPLLHSRVIYGYLLRFWEVDMRIAKMPSLNFFIVNPFQDFGDEPSLTIPRRSDLARGS